MEALQNAAGDVDHIEGRRILEDMFEKCADTQPGARRGLNIARKATTPSAKPGVRKNKTTLRDVVNKTLKQRPVAVVKKLFAAAQCLANIVSSAR